MANRSLVLLCEAVLEDHFGSYVKCVGSALLERDLSFVELRKQLKGTCRVSDICRSIAIMELHGMVLFTLTNRGVLYSIVAENVLHLVHLSRAIQNVKRMYGELCGQIVNELAFYGRASYEKCISALLAASSSEECQQAFMLLAQSQLIRKCDVVISTDTGFPVMQKDPLPFVFKSPVVVKPDPSGSRKRKLQENNDVDVWCINWPRVERYLHNELILSLICNHKDYSVSDESLWRSFLSAADSHVETSTQQQSEPITVSEISRNMKETYGKAMSWDKIDSILMKFAQTNEYSHATSTIIRKTGESAGGLYIINYAAAIEMFCNEHVESVLRERIDDRALRIFRLLRMHTNIEEDLLPKLAMLAPKETKEICYLLIENGYIFSRPIAKTNDFAPSRSVYFYSYRLPDLISNVTGLCYDSLRNVIFRRLHEVKANKILLDARQKIETIVATINSNDEIAKENKLEQAKEVEDNYMTEEDKRNFQRHVQNQKHLSASEIGIAQTLFVFQLGRWFNVQTSILEAAKTTKRKKATIDW